MIIQFCGLSGSGKTTLAQLTKLKLEAEHHSVEVINGDSYRETLCKGLGFSKEDRQENFRRMAFVAGRLSKHGIIAIISAINPYEETREETRRLYANVSLVHIDCPLDTLRERDTKGLYRKALLPDDHPEKIFNLTGVNDHFDLPKNADLYVNTSSKPTDECAGQIVAFIKEHYAMPWGRTNTFVLNKSAKAV